MTKEKFTQSNKSTSNASPTASRTLRAGLWILKSPVSPFIDVWKGIARPSVPGIARGDMVRAAWARLASTWSTAERPRRETFEQAQRRKRVSDTEIAKRGRHLVLVARWCYGIAAVAFAYAAYLAAEGEPLEALRMLSLTCCVLTVSWGGYAFRAAQIAERRLLPFREFVARPEFWFV